MNRDFDLAVAFVLAEEGGYSNNPADPGGETNFGISRRAYPNLDIRGLSREAAIALYRRDYWDALPALPGRLAVCVFDFAVNAGLRQAIMTLQAAIGTTADGVFGPVSRGALARHSEADACVLFCAERARFYAGLRDFPVFGKGWLRRTFRAFREAMR